MLNLPLTMILYFDTETTGLRPGQIAQLSYVMQTDKGDMAKNFFFTVDSMDYGAFMVHGFSVEKLKSLSCGKRFRDHFDEIEKDFNSADLIVCHNTAFDFMFMRAEFSRLNKVFYVKNEFCTMKGLTSVCKLLRSSGAYKYPKLSEACAYFNINNCEIQSVSKQFFGSVADFHDARFDTTALYLVANFAMEREDSIKEIKKYL